MKILISTGLYAPDIGGPATYTKMLEAHLPAQGFDLSILPFSDVRTYPKIVRHFIYAWRVWKMAKGVDVVYALDPISVGLPSLLATRLRGKKLMLRLGGDYAWEQGRVRFGLSDTLDDYTENPQNAGRPVRVLARIQTYVAQKAVVIVAPSQYLKNVIVAWGIPAQQVKVIYSSLVPTITSLGREVVRQKMQLSSPVISTAGRLVPWKGMRVLIEAVADLKERFPEIVLLIIGDGPEEETLKALVAKYDLSKHVRFMGRAGKTELANLISASDLFVLNTAYEGLSHQLLEVMDLGVPIVTTTAGGNTELLSDGVDAFLVPFNEQDELASAMTTVLTNPETVIRLTQFARARSKEFTEERAVADLVKLLHVVHKS